MLKILMLVNWKVIYSDRVPEGVQPPNYLIPDEPYWFFRYFKEQVQVDVIDTGSFPWLENFERNKIRFYIWQALRAIPKLHKYDLVLSHGAQSGVALSLFRRFFPGKAKHVLFDIGAFNSAAESGMALKFMQWTSKSFDGVIYHESRQIEYYEKMFPWLVDRARFILYGADSKYFIRENHAKPKQTILCIGYRKRDWDTVVKAYADLIQRLNKENMDNSKTQNSYAYETQGEGARNTPVPELYLIGTDCYMVDKRYETIPNLVIRTIKSLSLEELIYEIQASWFGVLPLKSFNYSFGQMTLLQQMALGKAVITAKVPSMVDYVEDGVTGLLYESENDNDLSEKMYRLCVDEALKNTISQNALRYVKEQYNEKHMAEGIELYLHEVMRR